MSTLTLLRIVVTCSLLVAITCGAASGTVLDAYRAILGSLIFAGIPLLIAATESEALPEKTRVPRSRALALLASPWLPGGGRGALFLLLHLSAAFAAMWCFRAATGEATTKVFHIGVTCLSATAFVLGWSAFMRHRLESERGRAAVRALIASSMLVCWFSAWWYLESSAGRLAELLAQVMCAHVMGQYITNSGERYAGHPAALPVLALLVLVAIAGNVPRMIRGVREVIAR